MKHILLVILSIFGSLDINAQFSFNGDNGREMTAFTNSDLLYVVLTGNATLDNKLKEAVTQNWSLKPVQYIDTTNFAKLEKDDSKCFLIIGKIPYDKGGTARKTGCIAIINGHHKLSIRPDAVYGGITSYDNNGENKLGRNPEHVILMESLVSYVSIPDFSSKRNLKDWMDKWLYKLPLMVSQLQSTISLIKDMKLSTPNNIKLSDIYTKNAYKIRTKILLIDSADVVNTDVKSTESDFKKIYKYPFEVCNKEKIKEVLATKNAKYMVLSIVNDWAIQMVVHDPSTFECVYSNFLFGIKNSVTKTLEDLKNKVEK